MNAISSDTVKEFRGCLLVRQRRNEDAMSKNLYIHTTDSKGRADERGSPYTYASVHGVPYRPEDFLLVSGTTAESTIAMHEQLARNWGSWNVFCKQCYDLMRPFYIFPLEMAQQYFSFILGMQQCVSEPVGQRLNPEPGPTPGPRLINREEREEIADAFDVAIGATPELWAEVVHVGRGARAAAA